MDHRAATVTPKWARAVEIVDRLLADRGEPMNRHEIAGALGWGEGYARHVLGLAERHGVLRAYGPNCRDGARRSGRQAAETYFVRP